MKLALDWSYGQYLEGDNDEELLNCTQAHAERNHLDIQLTDEQIRQMLAEGVHDTQGKMREK